MTKSRRGKLTGSKTKIKPSLRQREREREVSTRMLWSKANRQVAAAAAAASNDQPRTPAIFNVERTAVMSGASRREKIVVTSYLRLR